MKAAGSGEMIRRIDSSANDKYKLWRSLLEKRGRDSHGSFLLEGQVLIGEALDQGWQVEAIILKSADLKKWDLSSGDGPGDGPEHMPEYRIGEKFLEAHKKYGAGASPEIYELNSALFDKLSQTEHGKDIIACVRKPVNSLETITDAMNRTSGEGLKTLLILDRIQDPGNMGTIIRTADAAGVPGLILLKGSCDPFSPKVVRAAAGSVLRIPMAEADGAEELRTIIDKLGVKLIATGFTNSKPYTEENYDMAALVIGNEGAGVSEEIMDMANSIVRIPMRNSVDSLNAGVASAVIIYECVRQNLVKRG